MIELFENSIKTNDRKSSKGNQLKWMDNNIWYKADSLGYEGLAEYVVSHLLLITSLDKNEFVLYNPVQIRYKTKIFKGASSVNFLNDNWQIITLERLFLNKTGKSLNNSIWAIRDPKERLKFIVSSVENLTGLKDFGKYMNKIITIDAVFLNEDRHTHNLAVLMNDKGEFDYCPIFDNGACLLSDTAMEYPLEEDVYSLIDSVKGKTFSSNLEEQMDVSEILYGVNIKLEFTKKDVEDILDNDIASIYSDEERSRVKKIIFEQMKKYPYLF